MRPAGSSDAPSGQPPEDLDPVLPGPGPLAQRTVTAIAAVEVVALGSLAVPLMLGLAMKVNRIETTWRVESALSLVTAFGALAALVANPILGAWCDRRRHRGSGRADFVLGGVLTGVGAVALLLVADNLLTLTLVWMLAQFCFNACFAALYGYIADLVPEHDRARVAGVFGAAAVASVVFGMGLIAVLPKTMPVVLLTMPALAIPVTLVAFAHLRGLPRPSQPSARTSENWAARLGSLRGQAQYWRVWWQRLGVQLTYGVVSAYGLFFLIRRVQLDEEQAATWVSAISAVSAVVSAVMAVLLGRWASKRGSYGPFILTSMLLIGVALVLKAVGTTTAAYAVATLLVSVGIGSYYAVDLALVLRTVPATRAGFFLGFFNIARTLPQSLVPALAPWVLLIGDGDVIGAGKQNYFALYVVGLVVLALALLPLRGMSVLRRTSEQPVPEQPVTEHTDLSGSGRHP